MKPFEAAALVHDRRAFLSKVALGLGAAAFATPGAFADELVRTPSQTEGPFYPDKLPLDTDNDLLVINDGITPAVGEVTFVSGRILDAKGDPVRNAVVEILQCDSNGAYLHSGTGNRDKLGDRGAYEFHRWLRQQIAKNRPYDEWVRELVTASGSAAENGPVNFFRAAATPEDAAKTVSRNHVDLWRTRPIRRERDLTASRRPRRRRVERRTVRQTAHVRAVPVRDVNLRMSVARGRERDSRSVGRPRRRVALALTLC